MNKKNRMAVGIGILAAVAVTGVWLVGGNTDRETESTDKVPVMKKDAVTVELARSVSPSQEAATEVSEAIALIRQEQEIINRMKKMQVPCLSFKPPATIIDAVNLFRSISKEYDDSSLPPEERGFNFVLRAPSGKGAEVLSPIPPTTLSDVSLYEALKRVCDSVGYVFKVRGQMVIVMHKVMLEVVEIKE